jgi:subtilisin-like proprotein convertase family protein
MAFFNFGRWLHSRPRVKTYRKNPTFVPWFEALEDRTLMSTLPAAVVTNQTTIAAGFSPTIVQDPTNASNLVEFQANSAGTLGGSYSRNGGSTWTAFPTFVNIADPALTTFANVAAPPKFTVVTNPTAAWDRSENIYITEIERNTDNSSGALVFQRFSFSTGAPVSLIKDTVLERWFQTDPILNPVVAVDNNLPTFTDPVTAAVQTDTMVGKAVYVAWNTLHTAPTTFAIPNFNPDVIKVVASADLGVNFTTPQFVNSGTNANVLGDRYAAPQIVFIQGSADGRVQGGQLVFAWSDFAHSTVRLDSTQPDAGILATKVADSDTFNAGSLTGVSTATPVPAAGTGSGYSVGDILTVVGGTGVAAELVVTSVDGTGAITGFAILQGGLYTVNPTNPVSLTGGTGAGAQANLTFITVSNVVSATFAAGTGGTGYAVGDILTVSGGTVAQVPNQATLQVTGISVPAVSAVLANGGGGYVAGNVLTVVGGTFTAPATITVNTVGAGGVISTFTLTTGGSYTGKPANPVSVTGGSGTLAKFTMTYSSTGAITKVIVLSQGPYTNRPPSPNTVTVAVTAAAVAIGGSGYNVNDVLNVVGGTGTAAQLKVTAIARSVTAAAISGGGGSGYNVGDVLTVLLGTGTAAKLQVTTIGAGGAVTGVLIYDAGGYTALPASPVGVSDAKTPAATGAKFTLTFSATGAVASVTVLQPGAYTVEPNNPVSVSDVTTPTAGVPIAATFTLAYSATGMAVTAILPFGSTGSGYTAGDTLTVVGGTGTAAQLMVDTVDGNGGITKVTVFDPGSYTATPTNAVSVTGGTGTDATFNLNYSMATVKVATATAFPPAGTGSGYADGDVLTVTGGNFSTQATLTVAAINAATGAILTVNITNAGNYFNDGSQPTSNVVVTGGSGINARFTLTYNAITVEVTGTPTFAGTGKGYFVGDILTVVGGTGTFTAAQLQVTKVDLFGAITAATTAAPGYVGSYTGGGQPVNPVSVTPDPLNPSASGGAFTLTYSPTATGATPSLTFRSPSGTGSIPDALPNPTSGQPDIPQTVTYSLPVSIANPAFVVGDLEVTLDIVHPHLNQLQLVLVSPSGTRITLLNNSTDNAGNATGLGVPDQGNVALGLGVVNIDRNTGFSSDIGTVFDPNAPRPINDASATAPYAAHFKPEAGSLAAFNGQVGGSANLTGTWTLEITDNRYDGSTPPFQRLDAWSLHFTSKDMSTTGFGTDRTVTAAATVAGAPSASSPYPLANVGPYGPAGVGPDLSVAVDNTLGSYSPFQGRVYLAYTGGGGTDTNVLLASVDNLKTTGATFNRPVKVNDDSVNDHFSEGNRPQFMPTVAVDPVTGTVGVMYYDGRWDAAAETAGSLSRVANSFSASLDGGATFSPSTFFNTPKTAIDAITGKTIVIEPVPGNQPQAGVINGTTFSPGFGDRQGLVMNAGHVIPVFSSNENAAGLAIKTATVIIAAGPRIVSGDMGPIPANTVTADGTPVLTSFQVQFDRPVDPSSFTGADVTVEYRDTVTTASLPANLIVTGAAKFTITALDLGSAFGPGLPAGNPQATTFRVSLNTPLSGVGTYSYAIGPTIKDSVRSPTSSGTLTQYASSVFAFSSQFTTTSWSAAQATGAPNTLTYGDITTAWSPLNRDGPPNPEFLDLRYTTPVNATGVIVRETYDSGFVTQIDLVDTSNVYHTVFTGPDTSPLGSIANFTVTFATTPYLVKGVKVYVDPTHVVNDWEEIDSVALLSTVAVASSPGNLMDQNHNAITNEASVDVFAIPTPVNGVPFMLPYSQDTLPLIIPGPHVVSSSVDFNPASAGTSDNLVLNGTNNAVDVTFDRNMQPGSFTAANILRIEGPAGPITTYTLGPLVTFTGGQGSGAMGFATVVSGLVTAVTITNPGTGYTSAPTVVFTSSTGAGATGTASIGGGGVTGVTITNPGIGYSTTTGAGVAIPAGGTLNVPLAINDSLQVNDLSVGLNIAHAMLPELSVFLIAPDSTQVQLFSGAPGQNLTNTIFDDNAATGITGGLSPGYTGIFRPVLHALAAVNTGGGSGYKINDALTVAGGVFSTPTQLKVTSVGALLGALAPAAITAGGTLYNVGDVLTVSGGTFISAVQIQVTSVGAGGVITGASVMAAGSYTAIPGNPVSVSGGAGSGAKFNLAFTAITGVTITQPGAYSATPFNPVSVTDATNPAATGATFALTYSGLSALNGKNYLGTWTLRITDNGATAGTLNSWSLNPVSVTPNPPGGTANRTFRITLPTQTLSGSYSLVFGPDTQGNYIKDVNGHQIDTNLNAGVDLLRGGDPVNGAIVPNLYPSGPINTPLPADRTVDSVINVPDSFLVEGVTLQLSIQHQNDPDLTATLIAPDLTSVQLFSGVGTSGTSPHANFTNTTFDDAATFPIQLAATQPVIGIGAGPFNPQLPLSTFKNHGSFGNWTLRITSKSSTLNGTLVNWNVTLKNSVPGSGLGEPVADQFSTAFRIFTQDPTSPVAQQSWTAVGGASLNGGGGSGRIGGVAVDPSDSSGNTVYTAGASGGVWKTTNFLSPSAPTWVPLTDLGPGFSLNTGSIAVFGRNKDPNQSIVFVATGEGDIGSPGVGFLRSMDAGKTWRLLDSTTNAITAANKLPGEIIGTILPINDPRRDHKFLGATSFRVLVDPKAQPNGEVIVYAALSGANGGIWRSVDTGKTWSLILAGSATDIALSAGSAGSTGNLQILYAAIQGSGVYFTTTAPTALSMSLLVGGQGVPTRRDINFTPDVAIPVAGPSSTPNGAKGRITLATPALTGNPLQDALQEGWLYALVEKDGAFEGLYLTKDFGLNWTKVRLPNGVRKVGDPQIPTNDESIATDYSVIGSAKFAQGSYNQSLAVDPNNPNIVYMGGTSDGNPYGFIRIDVTTVSDPYALIAYDNSNSDGGKVQFATTGGILLGPKPPAAGPGAPFGLVSSKGPYFNQLRDPNNPFITAASLQFTNVASFTNNGQDALWMPFSGGGLGGTDQHELVAIRDPLTGRTRVIFGDDQGVWTGTDTGDGTADAGIGFAASVLGSRNGNLQITQFYYGAAQPSTLAADLAGTLFYGSAQDDGAPTSDAHVLDDGNIRWSGPGGDYAGVATDQTGSGSSYLYAWPCCGATPLQSDFFLYTSPSIGQVSRVTGLLQSGDDPGNGVGQWPAEGTINFAVNPIDPTAIVISSTAGRVFRTSGPSIGTGIQWFPIADPGDLDGNQSLAMAFGAPADANAPLSDFIYVGTNGGKIFVTFTGGGVGSPWKNISAGLSGGAVQAIVTNPTRGSHEAYAVTSGGVFWMADSSVAAPAWVNITGNLFSASMTRVLFNDPSQALATLKYLTSIQADYRYAIPDNLAAPNGPKHPVLYVGGEGGVYRSLDKGVTWTYFPNQAVDGSRQAGGFLPSAHVTDLDFALGDINPKDGTPYQPYGRNLLLATTYGRASFAIRLDDQIRVPGGNLLYTYAVSPVAGPHVASTMLDTAGNSVTGMTLTFSGPVDPVTVTTADINGVTDPFGNPVPVADIVDITGGNPHNVYRIDFVTPQTAYGFYHISLGPNISDYSGYKMDQNQNNINGENPADVYNARFLYQPFTNHAPVLTATSTTILPVFEDVTQAGVTPTSINSLVLGLGWPTPGLTDADNTNTPGYETNTPPTFAPVGIAVTSVDNTNGLWEYSLDNGTTWNSFGAAGGVDNLSSAALLLEANSNQIPSQDLIEFLPNAGFSSTALNKPSFTFKAWDLTSGLTVYGQAGGTADTTGANSGGTTAFSTGSATATTTVLFVNDQPSFTANAPPQTVEDSGLNTVNGWASGFNPGGAPPSGDPNEQGQTVLQYIVGGISNAGLFAVAPAVDKTTGNLTYTLNPDTYGTSTFNVQAQDSGGTPVLAAAVATGGSGYKVGDVLTVVGGTGTAAQLQVTSISGAGPTGPITGVAILQDGAYNLQPPNTAPTGSVTDVAPGTGSGATFTFTFATQALTATLTPGGGGSGYALGDLLQVQGGTPVGPAAQATVTAVGAVIGALTPAEIGAGSTGYAVGNVLTVVGGTFSSPVTIRVTSVTAGAITGATVTAAGSYTVLPTDPVSVTGGAGTNATFNLASLFSVVTAVQLTQGGTYSVPPSSPVNVTDLTTPAASGATLALTFGYVDLSVVQTFTISALFVNDQPTFIATNQGANENSGAHTVTNWATFVPGGTNANESAQSVLGYTVTGVTNTGLFTAAGQPKVSNAGTLTYTLLPNVSGTSSFNVTVQDNGGMQVVTATGGGGSGYRVGDVLTLQGGTFITAAQLQVTSVDASGAITGFVIAQQDGDYTVQPTNPVGVTDVTTPAGAGATFTLSFGGVDTSAAQTFTLKVNLINDQPAFTANNPPTVNEDSGAHTVSPWVISFNPGGSGEESGQTVLAYNVGTPSNPGLFATAPAVDTSGKLTYTLKPDVSGTSTFAVTATDNGGTQVTAAAIVAGSAGTNYQVGDSLTVAGGTLVPVTGSAAQLIVTSIGAGGAITGVTLYNDGAYTDAGLPTTPNSVTSTTGIGTGAKFTLTFGGVDTSVAKTFTLTVTFVNDQPSFAANNPPAANVSTGAHTVTGWATFEPDGNAVPAANEAGQLVKAYTVSAVSNPSLFTATGKPAVDTSGNLTYTLAAGQSGTSTFTVVVQDNGGVANGGVDTSAAQTFTLTVQIPVFTFNPATLPNATAAVAYSQTIVASGGTAPYTYTISSGALPAGLSLSSSGTLSGTPTAAGGFSFNVQATDATSISGVQGYTLTVNPPVFVFSPTSLPGGQAGVAYSQALTASGGDAPYSNFTISAGALPAGLALSGAGTISGTPAAVGTFSFTVTAQDSTTGTGAPYKSSQNFSLTVAAPSITLTPSLPGAQAGAAYNQTLTGSGGTAPYTFTVTSGTLPTGLSLAANGAFAGTPTAVGSFTFTVQATDSTTGTGAPFTGSQSYTVAVAAPTISFAPATLVNTIAGVTYSQTITGQGGTAPYSNFTITAGALPAGLTLSSSGTISGSTSSFGTFNFTVRAQDSTTGPGAPYTGSQNYSLTVSAPFDPTSLSAAMAGAAYSQAITAVAGSGPATNFSVTGGALPNGITLTSAGLLSGTATVVGSFTFTVSADDTSPSSGPFTAMQQYTLVVSAPDISFTPATLTAAITGIPYSQTLSGAGGTAPYSNFTLTAGVLPSGLTLSSGGVIAGTTTALGNYSFTVQAQDSTTGPGAPYKGSQNYTLTVSVPFTPASLPAATAGANYNEAINAIAGTGPASNFSVTGALPGGVTLSSGGVLNGTPTAVGTFTFTVSASDSSPASGSFTANQQYTLTVSPPNIVITPATLAAATAGVAYNQVLSGNGGTAPYSQFTLASGALPAGLTLSSSGTLAGTPTAVGTFNFTVQAQDSTTGPAAPYTGSTSYSLVVNPPVITFSPASLTAATAGVVYSQTLSGVGGTAPYSNFKVTSGALPAGLTLSSAGTLGGTATATGTFNFTVTAQDSTTGPAAPYTGSQNYSLVVNAPVIVLSPNSLTAAKVGAAYTQTLTPSGGNAPYSNFMLISGSLPAGISLNAATGVLSGTPTAGGSFSFTVQVQDSTTGAGAPYTGTQNYSLTVNPAIIVLSTLPAAQVGATYNQTIVPSGGTAPYTLQLTSGTLPAGLTFNASTGVVSGKPTAGGTFNFTVTATDSSTGTGPYTGSHAYTFTVAPPTLVFSPTTLPGAQVGVSYSQTLTVSGGTAPYHGFSISSGALPAGLTLSATGTIAGTPTVGGTFNFTVQATDSSTGTGPYTLGQNFSLTVAAPNLVVSPATLPAALVAVPYSVQITVTGGTAPYKNFVVTTGTLPAGLTLSTTGLLSGLPTGGGTFNFTVGVTDSSTGGGPYTTGKAYSISVTPPNFSYDAATKALTITGANFTYSQSTTANASGTHTNYTFTMDGYSETLPDTTVSSVVVNGTGSSATAILITNDTYTAVNGSTQETPERVSLGSLNNDGTGTVTRFTNNDASEASFTFLTLHSFPISYAYVGRNDSTVNLYGTVGEPYNGFVTAGNYSYMGGAGMFHLVQGAASVYGYSAGQPADFAYHYAANPGSAFVVSGTAYSYMSTMDTVKGVTQSYFNVGVGFLQNTGVSKNAGADIAYFFDSPGNDTFVGGTTVSYMYIAAPPSPYAEFDAAYGFAMVNAQSFVGGIDFAYIYDTTHNNTSGFTVIYPGQIGRIVD